MSIVSNESVTDEIILAGFKSLHQAMAEGFDAVRAEFKAELKTQIGGLRNEMNRRFDKVEERLDDHEARITKLEAAR